MRRILIFSTNYFPRVGGALFVVATLSAGSVVWVRKKSRPAASKKSISADDFTITDIS